MNEKEKNNTDKGKILAALLAYLLNKYRLLPQDLVITILNEYGFSLDLPRQIGNNKQE